MLKRPPKKHTKSTPALIFTLGHSVRTLEEFAEILKNYNIKQLVDIRTIPRSWHNPQFNKEVMPESLAKFGISYKYMPGLGGLRHAAKDSLNTAWRNASFRGFADYMQTNEFKKNILKLINAAKRKTICLMCAESLPWRCHRWLVADALKARGIDVMHIINKKSAKSHTLTSWAKVKAGKITYPG